MRKYGEAGFLYCWGENSGRSFPSETNNEGRLRPPLLYFARADRYPNGPRLLKAGEVKRQRKERGRAAACYKRTPTAVHKYLLFRLFFVSQHKKLALYSRNNL